MTRGVPIILPGTARPAVVDRWLASVGRERRRTTETIAEEPIRNAGGRALRQPAIQGYACLFDTAFEKDGEILVFRSSAFNTAANDSTSRIRVLLDHDPAREVGERPTLVNTIEGLAFRLELAGNRQAPAVARMVDGGDRAEVSVGCYLDESQVSIVAGHAVRFVTKATLREISLTVAGAVPTTYAKLVDLAGEEPDLWLAARQPGFKVDQAGANLEARIHRVAAALGKLRA